MKLKRVIVRGIYGQNYLPILFLGLFDIGLLANTCQTDHVTSSP